MGKAPSLDGSEMQSARLGRLLDDARKSGAVPVLLIDDADRLPESVLPLLAFLIGDELPGAPRLKLILAGSPDLLQWLKARLPDLVGPTFELTEMAEADSAAYIRHCLSAEGVDAGLFEDEALSYIHKHAGGLPLRINAICQRCLDRAEDERLTRLDVAEVRRAILSTASREVPGEAGEPKIGQHAAANTEAPEDAPTTASRKAARKDNADDARASYLVSAVRKAQGPYTGSDAPPPSKTEHPKAEATKPAPARESKGMLMGGAAALGLTAVALLAFDGAFGRLFNGTLGDTQKLVQTMPPEQQQEVRDRAAFIQSAMSSFPETAQDRFWRAIELAEEDPQLAVVGYARAALMGHNRSAYYLGQIYETGEGVAVDRVLARSWYQQASNAIPGAARLLATLPEPQSDGPPQAPLPLFSGREEEGWIELVWTSAEGPDPSSYRIELATETGEIALKIEPVAVSALRISSPLGAASWRVVSVGTEGSAQIASPWLPIQGE